MYWDEQLSLSITIVVSAEIYIQLQEGFLQEQFVQTVGDVCNPLTNMGDMTFHHQLLIFPNDWLFDHGPSVDFEAHTSLI